MSTLLRRTLYTVAAGILLYVAAVLYFDVEPLRQTLVGYPWWLFLVALVLSSGNYLLRFAKWELSLGWLRSPATLSLERLRTGWCGGWRFRTPDRWCAQRLR